MHMAPKHDLTRTGTRTATNNGRVRLFMHDDYTLEWFDRKDLVRVECINIDILPAAFKPSDSSFGLGKSIPAIMPQAH